MARRRREKGRNLHGILILDKPVGVTSNEALQRVKFLYRARKAGHTGSLDRMASGMLPLCFGEATKFSGYLLDADKIYEVTCKLGIETTTGDSEGDIVREMPVPDLSLVQVKQALERFRGDIKQIPPMFSALKHKGQRLYELAYQGIEVERKPRDIKIHVLELVRLEVPFLQLYIKCSKGTYIRTLAEDIGRHLGCCACVQELRRTGAGPFREEEMVSISEIEDLAQQGFVTMDKKLLSIDSALKQLPRVDLTQHIVDYLCDGQAVTVPHAPTSGLLRIYRDDKVFLGLGEVLDDGRVAPRRLVNLYS
jgi:tRNA pseudouridine55 synthase